ncbi:MAG: DUF3105 domain-containing protein [Acidimicrobiales bacterium]
MRRIAFVLVLGLVAACGDDGDDRGSGDQVTPCDDVVQEALDPASSVHVVAGAPEPEYRYDPPTSGPHTPGPVLSGVLDEPLDRPRQIGQLEAGGILIQYRPDDLATAQSEQRDRLAGDGVAVVPNPDLPAVVVATAWMHKQTCSSLDVETLQAFVDTYRGQGPGAD